MKDFEDFQNTFRLRYISHMVDEIEKVAYPLRMYLDPTRSFLSDAFENLNNDQKQEYMKLCDISHVAWIGRRMMYKDSRTGKLDDDPDFLFRKFSTEYPYVIKGSCWYDYFQSLKDFCETRLRNFDELFGKQLRKKD